MGLPVDLERRRAALEEVLAAELIRMPDVDDLKLELDEIRAGAR